MTRAIVVWAHPDDTSFTAAIARTAAETLRRYVTVVEHDLYADGFNPNLTISEFRGGQTTDPLCDRYRQDVVRADALVVSHPNLWGAPPAILKGWMDRVFAPGSAYAFEKGTDYGDKPIGLLKMSHALVYNTGNTPLDREVEIFGDPLERIWKDCILGYCGVETVERRMFTVVAIASKEERLAWLDQVREDCERIGKALAG